MRRFFGSRRGAAPQAVSVAADVDVFSEEETDSEAREAHRKANKKRRKKRGGRMETRGEAKISSRGGQTLNGQ